MKPELAEKLNRLPVRLLADDVRLGKGLGNELGFFVFDYFPAYELEIREQIPNVVAKLRSADPSYRTASVNVFDQIIGVLEDQDLLGRVRSLEAEFGADEAMEAIRMAAPAEDVARRIVQHHPPASTDLYLLHGIGTSYPFLRAHTLLSNLHSPIHGKPVILFFPGQYTGRRLVLFGSLTDDNYYRAFRLFDEPC